MARTFAQACSGTYTGEAGSAASYLLADVKSVSKDRLIWLADFPGGNYRYKKVKKSKYKEDEVKLPLAGDETKTTETNALRNDRIGRVSMQKGGGTFNFFISPVADAPWLDKENVVVGQVEEGLDVIAEINEVKAAIKGGWINTVAAVGPGPAGDPRSDDFRLEPTEKIRILKSQVLQ